MRYRFTWLFLLFKISGLLRGNNTAIQPIQFYLEMQKILFRFLCVCFVFCISFGLYGEIFVDKKFFFLFWNQSANTKTMIGNGNKEDKKKCPTSDLYAIWYRFTRE